MNIYRGPSTKGFFDDSHERVDTKDLSDCLSPWHECIRVRVNVSKDHPERQAIVHVEFEPADVISLHDNMIGGLMDRSAKLDAVIEKIREVKQDLCKLRSMADSAESHYAPKALEAIQRKVESAIESAF